MKYIFTLGLILSLSSTFQASAQDALYEKDDMQRILESYTTVIVNMPGWEYKYTGNWLPSLTIEGDNTLTFTRGKVTHSYDLSKAVFVQEEGNYVKVWMSR